MQAFTDDAEATGYFGCHVCQSNEEGTSPSPIVIISILLNEYNPLSYKNKVTALPGNVSFFSAENYTFWMLSFAPPDRIREQRFLQTKLHKHLIGEDQSDAHNCSG